MRTAVAAPQGPVHHGTQCRGAVGVGGGVHLRLPNRGCPAQQGLGKMPHSRRSVHGTTTTHPNTHNHTTQALA